MPLLQIKKMSGVELLHHFAEILGKFPPHPNDYPILRGMKRLGFGLGKSWDRTNFDQAELDAINIGANEALRDINAGSSSLAGSVPMCLKTHSIHLLFLMVA